MIKKFFKSKKHSNEDCEENYLGYVCAKKVNKLRYHIQRELYNKLLFSHVDETTIPEEKGMREREKV